MNYEVYGSGQDVLLLHGWAQDLNSLKGIGDLLSSKYKVWLLDLPGFGESRINYPYDLDDYVLELRHFINTNKIENPILIGHSHGARIVIKYSAIYEVEKIVLIDAAGIVRRGPIYYYKVYSYKLLRTLLNLLGKKKMIEKLRKKRSSSDYNNASVMLREVLKRVYIDIRGYLKLIKAETLIIWGESDTITPIKDAKIMNKFIEHSGLVIIPNAGHFSFLDSPVMFMKILESYLL
ncbi:alpha/beta hydrolase [Mycoplasmatota bacterium zrk1]